MLGHNDNGAIMSSSWWRKVGFVILVIVAAIVGYVVFQRFFRVAATILLLAALLTYMLQPVVEWLVRVSKIKSLHAARTGATIIVYIALAFAMYGLGASVAKTITANVQDLRYTWQGARQHIPQQIVHVQHWYERTVPPRIKAQIAESVHREIGKVTEKYVPTIASSVMGLAKTAGKWLSLLIELIFVPLVAFYFLTDASRIRSQALFFVPRRYRDGVMRYSAEMDRILRKYMHGQLVLCAIAWVVVTIGLLLMGIPGALLLGVIAGVSRAIPVIGPLVGGIPVLASVLLTPQWAGAFWWVLIAFTALHFIESKFIMPRILGDHLGVHPVIVIVSLLVGYEMLGLLGMFLAPPAIAMIRFVLSVRRGDPDEDNERGTDKAEEVPVPNALSYDTNMPA
ncbi:MAG TPA: AI-2E family transporter [Armatimonadota bacterium]|nr:AI-2E family transporter [Armatimonadota bacterium]